MHAAQLEQDAGMAGSNRLARSRSSDVCLKILGFPGLLGGLKHAGQGTLGN